MGLFDIFKRKKPEPIFKGRVFDYHEDDFCRVELLPRENKTEIAVAISSNEKKVKTVVRKIPRTEIEKIVQDSSFIKFDSVTTGYSSMQYDSEFSTAYGEKGCAIIYECTGDIVDHIWLNYYPDWANEQNRLQMENCLTKICNTWDLILVDSKENIVVVPTNSSLHNYLNRQLVK